MNETMREIIRTIGGLALIIAVAGTIGILLAPWGFNGFLISASGRGFIIMCYLISLFCFANTKKTISSSDEEADKCSRQRDLEADETAQALLDNLNFQASRHKAERRPIKNTKNEEKEYEIFFTHTKKPSGKE